MHFDITFIIFVSNCLLKVKYINLLGWAFEYSLKSFSLRVEGFIFNFTFLCIFLVIKYTLKDRTRKFFAMRKIIGDRMCGSKKSNRHILKHSCAASSFIGQVICMDASNQKKVGRIYSTNERMFRSCYKCMMRGLIATMCQDKPYLLWFLMLHLEPFITCS